MNEVRFCLEPMTAIESLLAQQYFVINRRGVDQSRRTRQWCAQRRFLLRKGR